MGHLAEQTWSAGGPLFQAVILNRIEMARVLLAAGADPNANVFTSGSPTYRAYVGGNAEMIIVSTKVNAPLEKAFATFVDDFNTWWPRALTFSGDRLQSISIDPKMNGRAIEKNRDGGEVQWGTVLSFFRPNHIVIAWQITPNRQIADSEATARRLGPCAHPLRRADPGVEGGVVVMRCRNRRAVVCPSCSALYRLDAHHLLAAGLVGGKDTPASVAARPRVPPPRDG